MPELPEVETIVNDLRQDLVGLKIKSFQVVNKKAGLKLSMLNLSENNFSKKIIDNKIVQVSRRAKNIIIEFSDFVIAIHLKMTGQLIYENKKKNELVVGGHPIIGVGRVLPNKFTRAIFVFDNGTRLFFNDVRRFGWIRYYDSKDWQMESAKAGIEPLAEEFSLVEFKRILKSKSKATIKQAIMDQKYLVGVGNIYADEALFLAHIKPTRLASSLDEEEIKLLLRSIVRILKLSIKNRGTSFNDYVDARGAKGNFVRLLNVYGRAGQACNNCGDIIKKMRLGGRGTHWCDNCQR